MTLEEFAAIYGRLESAFGAQNEARGEIYFEDFQDADARAFEIAAVTCRRSCRFFPSIAELFEAMPGYVSPAMVANDSWDRVIAAACSDIYVEHKPGAGTYPTGERLTPEELRAAGGVGGLMAIRDASFSADAHKQLGFLKREFVQAYKERMTFTGEGARQIGAGTPERAVLGLPAGRMDKEARTVAKALPERSISQKSESEIVAGVLDLMKSRVQPIVVDKFLAGLEFRGFNDIGVLFTLPDPIAVEAYHRNLEAPFVQAVADYFGESVCVQVGSNF